MIYAMRSRLGMIKIGTTATLEIRHGALCTLYQEKLEILAYGDGDKREETRLHKVFQRYQLWSITQWGQGKSDWFLPMTNIYTWLESDLTPYNGSGGEMKPRNYKRIDLSTLRPKYDIETTPISRHPLILMEC